MNSFALMMAASRAINKKEEVIKIKPVVMKRKVGRPAAVKKPEQPIVPFPVVDLTQTSNAIVSRKNYDRGQAKVMMDFALQVALQSKGRHLKRTALMYGVERKPLSVRYHLAVNGVALLTSTVVFPLSNITVFKIRFFRSFGFFFKKKWFLIID